MNERLVRALFEKARTTALHDTPRRAETLAASFVRDNLAVALGQDPVDPDLVMDDKQIARILGEK